MKSAVTISNYETFFLLYVDNELSATERKAVEEFVQANPGLAVELEILKQVQLTGEVLVFEDKQRLYRRESEEISLANCEEQFLLFVDNELAPDAKEKVETFVLQHPAVQEGFTLLKQARLQAETIVFPYKESLYRKEEKRKPIFYLGWQRMAAAAALIGLIVLVWNVLPRNQQAQQAIAQAGQKNVPGVVKKNGNNNVPDNHPSNNNEINNRSSAAGTNVLPSTQTLANNTNGVVKQNDVVATVPSNRNATTIVTGGQAVNTNRDILASVKASQAGTTEPANAETVSTDSHNSFKTVVSNTLAVSGDHAALENSAPTAMNVETVTGGPNNIDVQPAVYKELDTEDDKKSLLLGSLEINKDKLRGFFRKAGSIFRSKSKTEDEKAESRPSSNTRSLK